MITLISVLRISKGDSTDIPFELQRSQVDAALHGRGTHFTAMLMRLIAKADSGNRARIQEAFPDEIAAYERWYVGKGD